MVNQYINEVGNLVYQKKYKAMLYFLNVTQRQINKERIFCNSVIFLCVKLPLINIKYQ